MNERIEYRTAIDFIEPEVITNEYRDASRECLRIIRESVTFILSQSNKELASLGVAYALGIPEVCKISMRRRCASMHLAHNAISSYCAEFKRIAKL